MNVLGKVKMITMLVEVPNVRIPLVPSHVCVPMGIPLTGIWQFVFNLLHGVGGEDWLPVELAHGHPLQHGRKHHVRMKGEARGSWGPWSKQVLQMTREGWRKEGSRTAKLACEPAWEQGEVSITVAYEILTGGKV